MGGCYSIPFEEKDSYSRKKSKFNCLPSSVFNSPSDDEDEDELNAHLVVNPISRMNVLNGASTGKLLQNYRIGRELGRGEFGVTRLCTDIKSGEDFACKSISKRRLRCKEDVMDVRREVDIMRKLPKHPNIVQFKEAYEDSEAVHLVMEICEGGELFDRIVSKGHYSERAAANVFKTIVEVVQLCHENGVMHRDLKPENFLLSNKSEDSPLKAIDFGLSVCFKPGQRFSELVGSPYYTAPEVHKRNYGPEIDVWSAGVILYILLCGVPPFWADTDEGIGKAILRCKIDFETEPWPKISSDAKDLVRRMLDPSPSTRLTAQQVLEHPWLKNESQVPNTSLGEVRARLQQFSAMNKFKKKALRVVAKHLTAEEMACIREIFDMLDKDKNGNLTLEELQEGLHNFGHHVQEPDMKMLLEVADVDGNGTLDCEEFATVSVHLRKIGSAEQLTKAFNYFDTDGSGYIEMEELKAALLEGDGATEQAIFDIISDVDQDKDGRISYQEFERMMKAGSDWRNGTRQYSRALINTLSTMLLKGGSVRKDN